MVSASLKSPWVFCWFVIHVISNPAVKGVPPKTSKLTCPAVSTKKQDFKECTSPSCEKEARIILDSMNTSVDPCQDFYEYACGRWSEKHPIPGDTNRYTIMNVMQNEIAAKLIEVLKNVSNDNYPEPVTDAANLFLGCLDDDSREAEGLDPLKNLLNSLGGWPMANPLWSDPVYHWEKHVALITHALQIRPLISVEVIADANRTSHYIIRIGQAKFGLRRREILELRSASYNRNVISAYRNFIIASAKLLNPNVNDSQVAKDANEILLFEKSLAKFTNSDLDEERQDTKSWYHKMTVAEVQRETENTYFEWTDFLNEVFKDFSQVTNGTEIIVSDKNYIKNAIKLAHETSPRILANYIGWILVGSIGDYSTKEFRNNVFEFHKILKTVQKGEAPEIKCLKETSRLMDFAVGRLYIDKYFPEAKKRVVEQLAEDVRSTYRENLENYTWMDENTRNKALEKLDKMSFNIAYPSWIKNDTELKEYYKGVRGIQKEEYFMSVMLVKKTGAEMALRKWNEPTNEKYGWVAPQVVNGFYEYASNTMKLPAGILNLPFYEYGRPQSLNFGGIGITIGHEIGHGFDDRGSEYDENGNLINWWSEETKNHFREKADCFRKQYSSIVEPTTNLNLNGNTTVSENIGDNGAVRNSFQAYKMNKLKSRGNGEMHSERLPGIAVTPDQLFFIGYSMAWCAHQSKESIIQKIELSGHTLNKFRVNVPLENFEGFAETFNCPSGSPMNPVSKCVLW